jgi:CBS domain-containing protein
MKVQDVMTKGVEACSRDTNLAAVAMIMWRMDCGAVPVVSDGRTAVGMITDRDICVAVATKHRRAEDITVAEVVSDRLYRVRPEDDIRAALEAMRSERVRRLPVVNAGDQLVGIISINDVIRAAGKPSTRTRPDIGAEDVLEVMKAICEHDGGLEVARRKSGSLAAHA